jgi:peptide/nickel transport system substrate-binding protein
MTTKRVPVVAAALCAAVGLAACQGTAGGGGAAGGGDGMIQQLTFPADVPNTVGGLVDYNPYSANSLTKVWLYEPLMIRNGLSC